MYDDLPLKNRLICFFIANSTVISIAIVAAMALLLLVLSVLPPAGHKEIAAAEPPATVEQTPEESRAEELLTKPNYPHPEPNLAFSEYDFFPLREQGDYSDKVFAFSDYLWSIGAENVRKHLDPLTTPDSVEASDLLDLDQYQAVTNVLEFDYAGAHVCLDTMFDPYLCDITSALSITRDDGYRVYVHPQLAVEHPVIDYNSAFWLESDIFKAFMCITQPDVSDACPFCSLGLPHAVWQPGDRYWTEHLDEYGTDALPDPAFFEHV